MNKSIRFCDLQALLFDLNFHRGSTAVPQIIFETPTRDALIVLPPYQPEQVVRPHHLASVRWTLDSNGILSSAAFDVKLQVDAASETGVPTKPAKLVTI